MLEGGGKDLVAEPSRYLRLEQNVWDGGATAAGVDLAKQSAELARSRVPEQEQDIDLQVISAWQTLQSANGRVVVADRLLKLLSDHEAMMTRRVQSELSTQVELQLVQAQVMQARLDRRKALLNASLAKLRLEQLTGIEGLRNTLSSPASEGVPERFAAEAQAFQGTDWAALANRQPTVRRAEKELLAAQSRIETKRSELRPQLYARVDRGLGSGGTTAAFVGVRYSTGAGFAASSEVDALIARDPRGPADRPRAPAARQPASKVRETRPAWRCCKPCSTTPTKFRKTCSDTNPWLYWLKVPARSTNRTCANSPP